MKKDDDSKDMGACMGSIVAIENMETKEVSVYTLTRPNDADPASGKISIHSPVAQGLMKRKAGELAQVALEGGTVTYKVLRVLPAERMGK
ncbi:GreA/GreB family elongation factor [Elusimicrobiota bacterium]